MDIIAAYAERWDTPLRTSKHHFLERFARRGDRVLYVEIPPTPLTVLRRPREFLAETWPRIRQGVISVAPNIWAVTGFFPFPYHRQLGCCGDHLVLNTWNQRSFLPRLRWAADTLGFRAPLCLMYIPYLLPILPQLAPQKVIFHMVDEWLGFEGIPRSAEHLIRGMVERADLTIVTSERLRRRYMPMGGNVQLLRHGTDIALFEPVSRGQVVPDERLQRLIGAKIGYYGAIHKLDLHLIRTLAISRPEWHFVFLGPTGGGSQGVPRLGNMPSNVYFLPPCPRSDLPAFLSGLDAFWMPFRIDELTRSMSPIKIFEVLGAGVPIVMSDLEECRAVAGPWGRFAVTADEHGQMLTAEMRGDSPARRLRRAAAVRNCDWEQRFATLCHLIGMEEI